METAGGSDLKSIRKQLGKSQSEMALLLGASVRAVQSYEQGWRPVPFNIEKLAVFLLFLRKRRRQESAAPCWEVTGCSGERRDECPAYQYNAGDLCWMLSGTLCRRTGGDSDRDGLAACRQCPAMKRWRE